MLKHWINVVQTSYVHFVCVVHTVKPVLRDHPREGQKEAAEDR